jgi:hypothetical protein
MNKISGIQKPSGELERSVRPSPKVLDNNSFKADLAKKLEAVEKIADDSNIDLNQVADAERKIKEGFETVMIVRKSLNDLYRNTLDNYASK